MLLSGIHLLKNTFTAVVVNVISLFKVLFHEVFMLFCLFPGYVCPETPEYQLHALQAFSPWNKKSFYLMNEITELKMGLQAY